MTKVSRATFSIFYTISFLSFAFSVYTILSSGMGITLWSDSVSYLNTALKLITEQSETSSRGRTILYPLFLAAFLGAEPSYHPVLLAQKGLFIVMSALTGLLCLRVAYLIRTLPAASSGPALVILLIAQVVNTAESLPARPDPCPDARTAFCFSDHRVGNGPVGLFR